MAQKITLKIGGHPYAFNAPTPDVEEAMRMAAEEINKKLDDFAAKFPGGKEVDRFAFVALNNTMRKIVLERRVAELRAEADALEKETEIYIGNTEKK